MCSTMFKGNKTSFILSAAVLVAYVLVYPLLYPALAEVTNLLSLVPVVVAAWLFGMRGGLLVGVLSFPINVLLMQLVGAHAVWESLNSSSEWFGQVAITVVGALVGRLHDLTELYKKQARKLEHQAFHDPLTSLPNTALFKDRLEHALTRTTRREGKVAVLFVDLDNFKFVNDTLGHHVGDELLVMVSDRLRNCRRLEDAVARLGGDEFGILLEEVASTSDAMRIAERILEELQTPFTVDHHEMFITSSIGVAFGESGQDSSEELIRNAAVAMHRTKEEGKACCRLFDQSMDAQMQERLRLQNDLRRALKREEFVVHYQPVVGADSGRIMGMEALVRWEHPERGLVAPDEFVPLAEELGLIVPIGRWVLREACRQAKEWQERYPSDLPLMIGVNLSARELRHPTLVGDVEEALREAGLDPRWLTLEITESAVVKDEEHSIDALRRLGNLGVRFALDDFGTGYSALAYLRRLPVG